MSKMKQALLLVILCACLVVCGCTPSFSSGESSDTVLAKVGDQEITQSKRDAMVSEYIKAAPNYSSQSKDQFNQQMLFLLVKDEALIQDARAHGIEVSDDQVNQQVNESKMHYPSEQDFIKALEQDGVTLDLFKHNVRMSMIANQLEAQVRKQTQVSDEQLLAYIKAHNSELVGRRSSHILFKPTDEQRAREVLQRIKNGEDLATLAKECSECPSKQKAGDLGWDCATPFVASFQEALNKLQKGEISDLVKTEFGWHIIQCTDVYNPADINGLTLDQVPQGIQEVARKRMISERRSADFHQYKHAMLQEMVESKKIVFTNDAQVSTEQFLQWDESTNPIK